MRKISALLLAAGMGTRLQPLTDKLPKCLMPIGGIPLLEHWLSLLYRTDIHNVLINTHHHKAMVEEFLLRARFNKWVKSTYEQKLLGTAETLRQNASFFKGKTVLLAHADNWINCNFSDFLDFHVNRRPDKTIVTMMTFRTTKPKTCGIVEIDPAGVVQKFHEKVTEPPGNLANGAVYLLEPEVTNWLLEKRDATDFSIDVVPAFLGRIATWENTKIHRDIGTINSLRSAQNDPIPLAPWPIDDDWSTSYRSHQVHQDI